MSIYYCNHCGKEFQEPEYNADYTGVKAPDGTCEVMEYQVCPSCWSDDIEERQRCDLCGDRLAKKGSDFCNECLTIIETGIRAFLRRYQGECGADYETIMDAFDEVIEERF